MQENVISCAAGWNKCWKPVEENVDCEQGMWNTYCVINWKPNVSDRTNGSKETQFFLALKYRRLRENIVYKTLKKRHFK